MFRKMGESRGFAREEVGWRTEEEAAEEEGVVGEGAVAPHEEGERREPAALPACKKGGGREMTADDTTEVVCR